MHKLRFCAPIIAAFGIAILFPSASFAERRVALVIGNNSYENFPQLQNAATDARGMAKKLGELGFDVILKLDASRRDIGRSLAEFEDMAANAEAALVFYAGHGVQADGKNYLIPSNAMIEAEVDLATEGISSSLILEKMENARANLNIVILDACRDNPLTNRSRSAARGLTITAMPGGVGGTVIVYSAAPGQVALDGPAGGYGVFTGALLDVLDEPGLKLEDVFNQTASKVAAASYGKQKPWINSSLANDFYFRPPAEVSTAPLVSVMDQTMYVSGDGMLNVRAAPDPTSLKLIGLDNGAALTVIGKVSGKDWYQVRLEGGISGFVWSKRLSTKSTRIQEVDREMYVDGDGVLNLRSGPDTRFEIVKRLEPGSSLNVTGEVVGKEWYRIGIENGLMVYAWSKRLSYQKIEIEEIDIEARVIGNQKLKVRSGPGTRYKILKELEPGDIINVTGKVIEKDWIRINIDGDYYGFVWDKRVSEK